MTAPPRWRAPLIGALLIPPSAFCAAYAYLVIQATQWSQQSLKLGPVCFLFVLAGFNGLVRLARRMWALTPGELALIYSMLVVATAIGGIGMVEFHITGLPVPYYSEFKETEKLRPLAPWFLSPNDPDVATQFFHGSATLYSLRVIAAWAVPALFWSGFLLLIFWVMLCINALVRRQWIEGERLTFPLVQLPLEMVREGGGFWNNRLMWSGIALAGARSRARRAPAR